MELSFTQIISFLWIARTIKFVLFWIYLWQLKEYHIGRFMDHFKTYKGKQLIFNWLLLIKMILLPLILMSDTFLYVLLIIYFAEFLVFFLAIVKNNIRKPKLTFKTVILIITSFVLVTVFFLKVYSLHSNLSFALSILLFDLFTPIIVSFVVLVIEPFFVVMRTRILKKATAKIKEFPGLKVIGITGSFGKTSTKEFLATMLSSKYKVLATPDHKNSEMGIAHTILHDLKPEHQIFIVEMGSYNKGGIKLLCDIVKPTIGIVTGVNEQHLSTFGSIENLLSAEGGQELVDSLPKNGLIVLNGNNKYCLDLYKKTNLTNKKLYTVKKDTLESDVWTEDVTMRTNSLSFIARDRQGEMAHFNLPVLGQQQVQNILGAILIAKEFKMTLGQISEACKNIGQKQAGMTLKRGIHGINVIDSSYSSNPDGVMAELDYLSIFPGKKVAVMPCLIELGNKSIEKHIQIGKKIAEVCDLAIITTRDRFKEIKIGATMSGMAEENIILCDKPQEILTHITTVCKEGDAVLLEGRVPKELIRLLNGKQI